MLVIIKSNQNSNSNYEEVYLKGIKHKTKCSTYKIRIRHVVQFGMIGR